MNLLHFHARKIAVCILIVEFSLDVFEFLIVVVVAVVVLAATASCVYYLFNFLVAFETFN